jgi:hypothetical protein
LAGISYGVKDIIETRGVATEYGSPIYKGRIGTGDAAIIRQMQSHGAITLGKTDTTAFASTARRPFPNNPLRSGFTLWRSARSTLATMLLGLRDGLHWKARMVTRVA